MGILLSYGISVVINRFVNLEEMNGLTGNLSRIPPWLSVAAVVFAIFVGMAAGFYAGYACHEAESPGSHPQ